MACGQVAPVTSFDIWLTQLTDDQRELLRSLEPCPLGLRVLASAFMHKTVAAEDVPAALRSMTDSLIGTER